MATHRETRVIGVPVDRLFDVVADVESYPDFVPLIRAARVLRCDEATYDTEQTLAVGMLEHRFRTRTELSRPRAINIVSQDRSFCRFDIRWSFAPLAEDRCQVDFALDCELRSLFLMPVLQMLILPMAGSMVGAFERRARLLAAQAAAHPGLSSAGCLPDDRRRE
jgi:coenzyme Q-binding protein COQ10